MNTKKETKAKTKVKVKAINRATVNMEGRELINGGSQIPRKSATLLITSLNVVGCNRTNIPQPVLASWITQL